MQIPVCFASLFCAIPALFFVDRKGLEQVSTVSGAGRRGERRRSDFTLLTCARNRPSKRFYGAGPSPQNRPAPSTPPSCTRDHTDLHHPCTDLRHPPHPPAPETPPTCTPLPETAAIAKNRHQNATQVQTRQGFGPKRPQPRLQIIGTRTQLWCKRGKDLGLKGGSPSRDCK